MGSGTRRRWSGKTVALHSALFHVESSLEALSPLGAGCWYSYTHTLQQQSSPGWTAGNSLSWQNSAFWQDSLLQQCLPVPAEGAAEAQLWQHDCSVLLPLPAQPCWSGIIHLIQTSCASGRSCSHFILSTVGPSLAAKAQSEHSLSHPTLLQTLVSFHIHCLLVSWFSPFSFPVYSVLSLFIFKGMSSRCQSHPLTAVGVNPWTSPQRCQCSSRQGLGLGACLDALLPLSAVLMPLPRWSLTPLAQLMLYFNNGSTFSLSAVLSEWLQYRSSQAKNYILKIRLQAWICDCKVFLWM